MKTHAPRTHRETDETTRAHQTSEHAPLNADCRLTNASEMDSVVIYLVSIQKNAERIFDYVYSPKRTAWRQQLVKFRERHVPTGLTAADWASLRFKSLLQKVCSLHACSSDEQKLDGLLELKKRVEFLLGSLKNSMPKNRSETSDMCEAFLIALQPNWQTLWNTCIGRLTPSMKKQVHEFRVARHGLCDLVLMSILRKVLLKLHHADT